MPEVKPVPVSITFRNTPQIERNLALRQDNGSASGSTARRDLERYYAMLERAMRGFKLEGGEVLLLLDISNGTLWDITSIPLLWAEVDDAEDVYFEKYGVERAALVAKLRGADLAQTFALVDAIERTWLNLGAYNGDILQAARKAGLLRQTDEPHS